MVEIQHDKTTLTVGICDDENSIHGMVEQMMCDYSHNNNFCINTVHYYSAKELLTSYDELDCLLLDIEMPEMDGIEAAFRLREKGVEYKIIMLTGRTERFKEAFEIRAFRFVSKPVDIKELYRAIDAVRQRLIGRNIIHVYRDGVKYEIVEKDVLFFEAKGSITLIYTINNEYRSEESLMSWMSILDDRLFYQCHKSYIVNMGKILKLEKKTIIMSNGEKVAVSKRRCKSLQQAFMEFDTKRR